MAGDNLTVTIGGDSSKLRADLKLTQAELKNLDRQINAAVKTGDTARAKELSTTFGVMKDRAVALDRSLKGLGATGSQALNQVSQSAERATFSLRGADAGARRLVKQLSNLRSVGGAVGGLAGGGLVGGVVGVGAGIAISKLIEQFDELGKSMREIRDLARESAVKPLMVQGMQELAKESGETAESANKFLTGLSSTIAKVATKTRDLQTGLAVGGDAAKQAAQNFAVFGDKVVEVHRGGESAVRDFSDALAILQVNEAKLMKLPEVEKYKALGQAFQRAEQNAGRLHLSEVQLNEISKIIFQVPAETADKLINAYAKLDQKTAELAASQRGATDAHIKQFDELSASTEKSKQQLQEISSAVTNWGLNLHDTLLRASDDMNKWWAGLGGLGGIWDRFWKGLSISANAATADIKNNMASVGAAAKDAVITLDDLNVTASRTALPTVYYGPGTGDTGGYGPSSLGGAGYGPGSRATQSILPGVSDYQKPLAKVIYPFRYAEGGMVQGPGTPTSDSVTARLSAGEFVMRAAAVQRWGPNFMTALNGIGSRMPSRGVPSFASGGMVGGGGGGGGTVILNLSTGGSYQLHGDKAVVASLTREARRAGMLNAGRMPGALA